MKTQIRRGVFETNSSSVHSISIIKDRFKGELPKEFTINCDGKFGWETCTYTDSASKAAYLYQAITYYSDNYICNDNNIREYRKLLQSLMDKFISNLEYYGIDVKCTYRFTKIEHIEYKHNDSYSCILFVDENGDRPKDAGYLDHGGYAKELVDYVLSSPENTLKFIFDSRCKIETGNDNDDIYWEEDEKQQNSHDEEVIVFEKGN